ncbi:MAG: thiolase domain-containing protein [Chloroflexota bacterium]
MRDVVILGVGTTRYGVFDDTAAELGAEAAVAAMKDAGVAPQEIQALFLGNCQGAYGATQLHMSPVIASDLGIPNIPSVRMETACSSGGVTFRMAYMAVAGGFYDLALVVGAESVMRMSTPRATEQFAAGSDYLYEASSGGTFPGFYGMIASAHINKYGTSLEHLAAIAVKNHRNAMMNPTAQFRKELTMEKAMCAFVVADPLRLFDCCPFSDGATAAIIASREMASRVAKPILIAGSGHNSDYIASHDREDPTRILAAELAAKEAYKQAGITAKDVDFAEVHDCFTIAEVIATEDLGFFPRGEAAAAAAEGRTALNGERPINASGGLKAKGHPVAATGIGQIYEVVKQLRGEAQESGRQIKKAGIGLAHNVGASGATASVHILRRL